MSTSHVREGFYMEISFTKHMENQEHACIWWGKHGMSPYIKLKFDIGSEQRTHGRMHMVQGRCVWFNFLS